MMYVLKVLFSACIIVLINVLCKRSMLLGSLLASIPLVSVLAIIWTYYDNHNTTMVANLTASIGWMVLPSLIFFILLPVCLRLNFGFVISMITSIVATSLGYGVLIAVLRKLGINY